MLAEGFADVSLDLVSTTDVGVADSLVASSDFRELLVEKANFFLGLLSVSICFRLFSTVSIICNTRNHISNAGHNQVQSILDRYK